MGNRELSRFTRLMRLGWGIADQGISSLMSLAVGVVAARALSAQAFGGFALALAAYLICLGTSRALNSEPFVVRFSGSSPGDRAVSRDAAGAAVIVGVVLGVVLVGAGLEAPGSLGEALVAMGIVLPILLLQDCFRFIAFATRRGKIAFLGETAWALALLVALVLLSLLGIHRVSAYALAWGGTAAFGALVTGTGLRVLPRPRNAPAWWRSQRDLAPRYLGEFTALNGASQFSAYLIGWIAGLIAAGSLRGAQVLMGPMTTLFLGISLFATPEGVVLAQRSDRSVVRFGRLLSAALGLMALVWAVTLMMLPNSVGHALLGSSWNGAREVLPGVGLSMVATGLSTGPFIGLRAFAAARRSLRVRVTIAPLTLIGAGLGAVVAGARGGALGMAIAVWIAFVYWQIQFAAELRERKKGRAAAAVDVESVAIDLAQENLA